jgi:hypothetical protein
MTTLYDQTCDPGYSRLRVVLDRYPALKDVAKTANIDEDEFAGLPDDSFAWPGQRRFPLHTREHAALSMGYRKMASTVPSEVDAMLEKAASVYEIDPSIFEAPQAEKTASEDRYVFPEKQRFLVKTAEDVKLAEQRVRECYPQLTVEDRAEGLFRLCKFAKELGVTLHPSTEKLAGFTLTSTQRLRDWIGARQEVTRGSVYSDAFAKIAESLDGVAPEFHDRDVQVKLAGAIHELDKEAGLTPLYGKKLPDPIQTVFNSDKLAAETLELGTGMMLNKQKLATLPLSFWTDLLGESVASEISSDGETVNPEALMQLLPTLPDDIKAVAQKQLAAYV